MKSKRWEIAFPVSFSAGKVEGLYKDTTGTWGEMLERPFSAVNFGTRVKFYIWNWLAPTVLIGYRYTFNTDIEIKQAFNSLYYSFGVGIGLSDLYHAIFKNDGPRKKVRSEIKKGEVDDIQYE